MQDAETVETGKDKDEGIDAAEADVEKTEGIDAADVQDSQVTTTTPVTQKEMHVLPPTSSSLSVSFGFGNQFLTLSSDISLTGTIKDTTTVLLPIPEIPTETPVTITLPPSPIISGITPIQQQQTTKSRVLLHQSLPKAPNIYKPIPNQMLCTAIQQMISWINLGYALTEGATESYCRTYPTTTPLKQTPKTSKIQMQPVDSSAIGIVRRVL
ncbi:hypothetical protein Tco_0696795 [Tanacetum coccineum]